MFGFARAVISPLSLMAGALASGGANAANTAPQPTTNVAVGPQYDSTHVTDRRTAVVQFPGGFIAEIHTAHP